MIRAIPILASSTSLAGMWAHLFGPSQSTQLRLLLEELQMLAVQLQAATAALTTAANAVASAASAIPTNQTDDADVQNAIGVITATATQLSGLATTLQALAPVAPATSAKPAVA